MEIAFLWKSSWGHDSFLFRFSKEFCFMEEDVLEIILVTEIKCLLPPNLSKGKIVFLNWSKV